MSVAFTVILFVGLLMVLASAVYRNKAASESKEVEYRYLPRDLDTYLREHNSQVGSHYASMFTDEDVTR